MDNIKKLLLVLVLLSMAAGIASADIVIKKDDIDAFKTFDEALGGYYGEIGGMGLSYQNWFGDLGFQTAFGLWYYQEDTAYLEVPAYSPTPVEDAPFSYNVGVEVMYKVYQDTFQDWFDGCLYVFAGVLHMGSLVTTYNYQQTAVDDGGVDTYPYTGKTGPAFVPVLAPGFGIGFEFVFFNHFSVPVEIGLMGAWELGTAMPIDAGLKVQGGLRYRY